MFHTHKKCISFIFCALICWHPCSWECLLCQDNPSIWQEWHIKKLIKQHDHYTGARCAGDNKRPLSKMCSSVTQHNATDQLALMTGNLWVSARMLYTVWLEVYGYLLACYIWLEVYAPPTKKKCEVKLRKMTSHLFLLSKQMNCRQIIGDVVIFCLTMR